MSYRAFSLEVDDGIARLVLNRPDAHNTMIPAFWTELPEAVEALDRDGSTRVLVISSTGRHFTAGMDLAVFDAFGDDAGTESARARAATRRKVLELQDTFTALERARFPVIAAVQGGCIGGGVDLVSACDMRYATGDAFFCIHEINVGITADVGTLQRLPHLVPQGVVRELAFTGRRLPADEARSLGLVNAVFPDANAMLEGVMAIAREIAARSPLAVWGTKEALNYARDHTVADALEQVATWQAGMLSRTDLAEGVGAQRERRTAVHDDLPPESKGI